MADGASGKGAELSVDELVEKAKGTSTGSSVTATNKLAMPDEEGMRLTRAGALAPFYDPGYLAIIVEESTVLAPVRRAIQSNVDGHGFTLKPRIDLDDPKIREVVADAIVTERVTGAGWKNPRLDVGALMPSPVDVDMRLAEIQTRIRLEKARAEAFFSACCPGIGKGFTALRKLLRQDRVDIGGCFLGVRRNGFGDPAEFEHLPVVQMRLRPIVKDRRTGEPSTVTVDIPVRNTPIGVEFVQTEVAFRTFVQFGLTRNVYFKEYGDHRVFSAQNGNEYDSLDQLPRGHRAATEVVYLKNPSTFSEYGVPEWIGATPCVTGLRASEEVNAQHFDENGIPRMMIIVSGGTLKDDADKKLADAFKAHSKGRKNYGAMVVIQATQSSENPAARCTIEVKPLKEAIPDDGLFQKYAGNMRDVILSQFRLPKFVLGVLDDVNKSSSEEGREFVENEVYQPARTEFDEVMNGFLESIGVYHWRFISNSPISRDPVTMIEMVKKAAEAGGATIDDVRDIMGDVFNRRFPATAEALEFGKYPIALATLKIQAAMQAMGAGPLAGAPGSAATIAAPAGAIDATAKSKVRPIVKSQAELVRALEGFVAAFDGDAARAQAFEVATAEGDILVIPMSAADMADLVTPS